MIDADVPLNVLVTGAGGFLGTAVVTSLCERGHNVRAVVRTVPTGAPPPGVTWLLADLRRPAELVGMFDGIDVVVHLAAAKSGGISEHFASTVRGTENLLNAIGSSRPRLVHISSFAVYDAERIGRGNRLDESSPVINATNGRDEYAHAKRVQERIIMEFAAERSLELLVIRPGVIYGSDQLWHGHLGAEISDRVWVRVGSSAIVPITYVENCAEAIALAVDVRLDGTDGAGQFTVNVVDDDLPTQRTYRLAVEAVLPSAPWTIPVPFAVARTVARFVGAFNRRSGMGGDLPPGLFRVAVVSARFQQMTYTNELAKSLLGWAPRFTMADALRRSTSTRRS